MEISYEDYRLTCDVVYPDCGMCPLLEPCKKRVKS